MDSLHIDTPFIEVDLGAGAKLTFREEFAVLEARQLIVGDDQGMLVARFPYVEREEVREGLWHFDGGDGKFTVRGVTAPHQEGAA